MKRCDYMKKLISLCEVLLFLIFLLLLFFTKEKLTLLLVLPFIIGIYLLNKKIKIKNYTLFIFILALLIRIISIFILKVEIVDDFKTMLDASRSLINNNLSFVNNVYFKNFSYQIGHVLYQAALLKIINSTIFLKIINSIITSLIVVFIYLISKKLFKEETARFVSLLYILYLYPIYLNSVLTNQHLPALLVLISIYLLMYKENNTKLYIIIALLLGIANIFRTESIVIILGLIIYNLISITKKNYKSIIKNIVVLLTTYLIFVNLISTLVYISPLKTKLTNNEPYWKFYCGLSDKYNGTYNEEDQTKYFNSSNKKELLLDRVNNDKTKLPVLFLKKEVILWTQTNYDLRITNNINSNLYNFLLKFNQGYLNLIIILFIISLFKGKEETNKNILLIKIILGLYFGVYLLIEISPRYAYILHILMFLILGISIERITNLINKYKNKYLYRSTK